MITTFKEYNANPPTPLTHEQQELINEYLESFRPKICCLESYRSENMTDSFSVKPFLKAIGWMIEKDIVVTHRMISDGKDLAHYVKYPDGIIWNDPYLAGITCFYLASNGKPGGLKSSVKDIVSDELIKAFIGLERHFNIVYFTGCEILGGSEGKEFVEAFLEKTGTVAVVGYTEISSWIDSMVIDTMFLSRFFEENDDRFAHLQKVYDSVIRDYRMAKDCGFSLFLNKKYKTTFTT
jgi:hypothetical protein